MIDLDRHGQMSVVMKAAAQQQDTIGWRHLTEGKVATKIRDIQELHLLSSPTRLTIDSWMKGFIEELLRS